MIMPPCAPIAASRSGTDGFTLLETLIAVLILSSIMVAGSSALITVLSSKSLVEERMDRLGAFERTTALLRQDLNAARPRIWESSRRNTAPRSLFGGRPTAEGTYLGLVRSGWLNPDFEEERSDLLVVEYRYRDGELTRYLVLRPDATRNTPDQSEVLLTGLSDFEVTFMRGGVFAGQWDLTLDEGRPVLPDTVNIVMTFETGEILDQTFLVGGR